MAAKKAINFTKAALDAVQPPDGLRGEADRITITDTKVQGLELRVTSSGVKTFSVYRWVRSAGRPRRITLGRYPDLSIENARKKAQQVIAEIADGIDPSDELSRQKSEPTLGQFFETYMQRYSRPHKRTWREDEQKFERYLANNVTGIDLTGRRLSAITRSQISSLHIKIGQSHPVTANRVIALVSSIFSRAIEWLILNTSNPAHGIKPFPEHSRDRFILDNEMPRFFAALEAEPSQLVRDFFTVSLLTGARRSNVLEMQWSDLDLAHSTWKILASDSKNGQPLQVTLAPEVVEILERRRSLAKSNFVFPGKGKTGHLREPSKPWHRILDRDELAQLRQLLHSANIPFIENPAASLTVNLKNARLTAQQAELNSSQARLPNLRIHDLRRTHGSWMAQQNVSLHIIGKALGHSSLQTTQIYARLQQQVVSDSVLKATSSMLMSAKKPSDDAEPSDG